MKGASATFLLAIMLALEANAESRLPPCPEDRNVVWNNCQGTLTLPPGDKYVGEFKDSEPNGQGTYTWPNGDKYIGEFKDGEPNGQGTYTWPNGHKYIGEFKDGEPNGQGTDTRPDGWPDGYKYVGAFKDGKKNGYGTLYSSNGAVEQFGVWKDDILLGSSAENSSNKAITPALQLPEKTDGDLPATLSAIAAIAAIVFFLMKDKTEPSVRVSSFTAATEVPATELEGAQRPQQTEQGQQSSPILFSQASELIQALERLSQVREKGILTDVEFEQEKKRILCD